MTSKQYEQTLEPVNIGKPPGDVEPSAHWPDYLPQILSASNCKPYLRGSPYFAQHACLKQTALSLSGSSQNSLTRIYLIYLAAPLHLPAGLPRKWHNTTPLNSFAQNVTEVETYFNIDWTSAGNDYESSGGGYITLKSTGGANTTNFTVQVIDEVISTTSVNVVAQGTSTQTYLVTKSGATITVSLITGQIASFSVGAPTVTCKSCFGSSDASGVQAFVSSCCVEQYPDDTNHVIRHHLFTAPSDQTIKEIPKADGHYFLSNTYIFVNTLGGNYLKVDEQYQLPNWNTICDFWLDAP